MNIIRTRKPQKRKAKSKHGAPEAPAAPSPHGTRGRPQEQNFGPPLRLIPVTTSAASEAAGAGAGPLSSWSSYPREKTQVQTEGSFKGGKGREGEGRAGQALRGLPPSATTFMNVYVQGSHAGGQPRGWGLCCPTQQPLPSAPFPGPEPANAGAHCSRNPASRSEEPSLRGPPLPGPRQAPALREG